MCNSKLLFYSEIDKATASNLPKSVIAWLKKNNDTMADNSEETIYL